MFDKYLMILRLLLIAHSSVKCIKSDNYFDDQNEVNTFRLRLHSKKDVNDFNVDKIDQRSQLLFKM